MLVIRNEIDKIRQDGVKLKPKAVGNEEWR